VLAGGYLVCSLTAYVLFVDVEVKATCPMTACRPWSASAVNTAWCRHTGNNSTCSVATTWLPRALRTRRRINRTLT